MLASLRAARALRTCLPYRDIRLFALPAASAAADGLKAKSRWQLLKAKRKAAPPPKNRVPRDGREAPVKPEGAVGLAAAIDYVRDSAWAKFDESVDIAVTLNIDMRHSAQIVRTHAELPHGTGKQARVAVLDGEEWPQDDDVIVGGETLLKETAKEKGRNLRKLGVKVSIAPAHFASKVAQAAGKFLGSKGLLPTAREGTIVSDTADLREAAIRASNQWVRLKADRGGIVHARVGRVSMQSEQIRENVLEVIDRLRLARPPSVKKRYIATAHISSTMGKSVALDVDSLVKQTNAYRNEP